MIAISIIFVTIIGIAILPSIYRLLKKPRDMKDIIAGAVAFTMWIIIIYGLIMNIKQQLP